MTIGIMRGETALGTVDETVNENLQQVRAALGSLIKSDDCFVRDAAKFPIKKDEEATISVSHVLFKKDGQLSFLELKKPEGSSWLNEPVLAKPTAPSIDTKTKDPEFAVGAGAPADAQVPMTAVVAPAEESDPLTLDERQWQLVIRRNQLLGGLDLSRPTPRRSFEEAFSLRGRVPTFVVQDGSEVNSVISYSKHAHTLVTSKIHKNEVNVSTPFVSVSGSEKKAETHGKKNSEETCYVMGQWNFPRVVLRMDERDVAPTEEFIEAVRCALQDADGGSKSPFTVQWKRLVEVFSTYGHMFPTEVTLGGQLYYVEERKRGDNWDESTIEREIGVAVDAKYKGISAGGGHSAANGKNEKTADTTARTDKTWWSTGGDALLAQDTGKWTASVGPHKNWRVISLEGLRPIYELLPAEIRTQVAALERVVRSKTVIWDELDPPKDKHIGTLAVSSSSVVWALEDEESKSGNGRAIWRWQASAAWQTFPGELRCIASCSTGAVFGVNNRNSFYVFRENQWKSYGEAKYKSCAAKDPNTVWLLTNEGELALFDVNHCRPIQTPSRFQEVAVASRGAAVWATDEEHRVFRLNVKESGGCEVSAVLVNGTLSPQATPHDQQLKLTSISAASDKEIWGIQSSDGHLQIVKWAEGAMNEAFDGPEGVTLKQVAVASDGEVWVVTGGAFKQIFRLHSTPNASSLTGGPS